MPRIDHVALWVRDLEAMCGFYASTFAATVGPLYRNVAKGFASRFLRFDDGSRLELMTTTAFEPAGAEAGAQRLGLTHLAIALGSEAAVDALTSRLRAAGVPVLDGPRRTGDGYYESVVLDPEGNRIELTA
jgi:lactoylglutathione lyase